MKQLFIKIWDSILSGFGIAIAFLTTNAVGQLLSELLSNIAGSASDDLIAGIIGRHKQRGAISRTVEELKRGKYAQGIDESLLNERFFYLSACAVREISEKAGEAEDIVKLGDTHKISFKERKELVSIFMNYFSSDEMVLSFINKSEIYQKIMKEDEQRAFKSMLILARRDFLEESLRSMGSEDSKLIVSLLKDAILNSQSELARELKSNSERLTQALDSFATLIGQSSLDNGGSIRFDELRAMQYSPKFMARRCPECGYCGQRLIYFEKQEMFHCCACGLDYSLIKGIEQDEMLMRGLDKLDKSTSLISASINELKASSYKQLADVKDKLAKCCNGIEDAGYTAERIEDSVNILSSDVDQIAERIDSLATEVLKKEYFESASKAQLADMTTVISTALDKIEKTVKHEVNAFYDDIAKKLDDGLESASNNSERLIKELEGLRQFVAEKSDPIKSMQETLVEQNKSLYEINENVSRVFEEVKRTQDKNDIQGQRMLERFDDIERMLAKVIEQTKAEVGRLVTSGAVGYGAGYLPILSTPMIEKIAGKTIDMFKGGKVPTDDDFNQAVQWLFEEIASIKADTAALSKGQLSVLDTNGIALKDPLCPVCCRPRGRDSISTNRDKVRCRGCGQEYYNVDVYDKDVAKSLVDLQLEGYIAENKATIKRWRDAHRVRLIPIDDGRGTSVEGKRNKDNVYFANVSSFVKENKIEICGFSDLKNLLRGELILVNEFGIENYKLCHELVKRFKPGNIVEVKSQIVDEIDE
ncbi:MAG: hypothetical protein IJZ04_04605 [Clostridia bacterium]|nr:hypothetical protein [Clostridia bacterium]